MYKSLNTISFRILFMAVLIVLLLIGVTVTYFYYSTSKILTENANAEFSQVLNQINSSLESQLTIIDSTIMLFISNPVIRGNLENEISDTGSYAQAMKKIEIEKQLEYLLLYNYLWDSKTIKSIYILENENKYYFTQRNDVPLSPTYEYNNMIYKAADKKIDNLQIFPPSPDDPTIYFVKMIRNQDSLDFIAAIIIGINIEPLSRFYSSIYQYQNAQAFIIDDKYNILLHHDKNLLGSKSDISLQPDMKEIKFREVDMRNEAYFIAAKTIDKYKWTSIVEVPKSQVLSKLSRNIYYYLNVILCILAVFLLLAVFFSSRVSKPIKDLMKNISQLRMGNFTAKMPAYKAADLNQLSEMYNEMTDEIRYLINDVYQKQLLLKESELKSLQAQINPHFLFNVLETVSWYARTANNTEIYEIITSLGQLLRTSITKSSREKVSIGEELQCTHFYLSIQKHRFNERLEIEINLEDEEIKNFYIPKLCLQPIVENAIVHGLEEKLDKGKLTVNIYRSYDTIVFDVIDDGVGFNTGDIDLEGSGNDLKPKEKHTTIGLYNSNKRIKLLYGEQYGITLESKINAGTKVTIKIPEDRGDS